MLEKVIGIDVGGTNIRVGLIDENFQLVRKESFETLSLKGKDEFLKMISVSISKIDPAEEVKKIGIALPVPWKKDLDVISDATNISFLESIQVAEIEAFFTGYEVSFENDVNVIAVLESEIGSSKGYENSLYITVSTGIASGIIMNNKLYHGANGFGGEVGSMMISDSAGIFSNGTLENLCSGLALDQISRNLFGENSSTRTIFEKYSEENSEAIIIIDKWLDNMSNAFASIIHMFDPGIIVLGGSVIQHNQWVVEEISKMTREKVFDSLKDKVNITISKFGSDAGIIGAGFITQK